MRNELLLHGIGDEEHASPIVANDALKAGPGERFELVLTNPPFGRKSSMTFVSDEDEVGREDLVVVRDDFWASTSKKQLNFVQHVKALLAIDGRAAVVVPEPYRVRLAMADPVTFLVAVAIAAAISAGVFAHASKHGSRHATAWGIAAFLAAGVTVPVYFIRHWLRRAARDAD
ncbi:MAG: N-6 DNA methylase [Gaiella sp.]|nr:N-6 DNA methylase [Gaiella sp.]